MPSVTKDQNALRPDAQAFDEIRIVTVPRYKQSGLSGDEWRISALVQFFRKGKLCHEASFGKISSACGFIYAEYERAIGDGKAYFAGDGIHCDQEGCAKPKTVTYQRRGEFCNGGHEHELPAESLSLYRHFCDEHRIRGNCGLDDADRNYTQVGG